MAAITIYSDFGAPQNKVSHCFHCFPIYVPQLELDMEKMTGSKPGKEYVKAIYCHPAYLTYMQSTS